MGMKYGIIGCGMMGHEHIQNINLLDGAQVTCVFDPVADLAQHAAQKAGGATVCDTMEAVVDQADALVIVSPNHLHLGQLEAIAAQKTLPILVEKPLYTDPTEATRVANFTRDYKAPVWVAMEYRYMPPIAAFLRRQETVTGGMKMLSIREHRFPFLPKIGDWNRFNANTGGTLVEKCCHFFDLMRLATGSEAVRVMASAGQGHNHLNETYDGQTPDIWDHGFVLVDFANGMRAMLELCMFAEGSRFQEEVCAVGPTGKIEALVPGPGRFWPDHLGAPPTPQIIVSPRDPRGPIHEDIPVDPAVLEAGDHNGATFYQHQRFLAAARGTGPVEVTLADGAAAVALGLAAQESARTGQAVTL